MIFPKSCKRLPEANAEILMPVTGVLADDFRLGLRLFGLFRLFRLFGLHQTFSAARVGGACDAAMRGPGGSMLLWFMILITSHYFSFLPL